MICIAANFFSTNEPDAGRWIEDTIFAINSLAIKCIARCRSLLFTSIVGRVYAAATCNIAL